MNEYADNDAQMETQAWIACALEGDQSCYKSLYDRYADGVYRLCYGLILNQQDAEDVVQETFVYAFKNLRRYQPARASFKTWLYTIAVSRSRNVHRRKRLTLVELTHQGTHQVPAPPTETPEAAMTWRELSDAVERALAQLTPILREAVVLRYGHGLTYREIAEVMDCPPKTAESRVRLAHGKLKEHLRPVGQGLLEDLLRI